MKLNNTWRYLAAVAMLGMGACSSSRQAAQNTSEVDDLYGNSGDAAVYAGDDRKTTQQDVRQATRLDRRQLQQRGGRDLNPDYADGQQGANGTDADYYTELSARQVQRGISPDPGWGTTGSYNDGFVNGYNQGLYGANSWNRWGLANAGLLGGMSLGFGIGSAFGYSPFGYSPFGYNPYAFGGGFGYNPYAYGGGFYDPFYSSYGFGNYGYSPFGYGGGFGYNPYAYGGGFYGRPSVINNNYIVTGADPYRNNRTYGPRGTSSSARYSGDFNNTAPSYNNGGRRSGSYGSSYNNSTSGDGTYYSNPNSGRGSSRGAGSYSSGTVNPNGGRTSTGSASAGTYYERPSRQGSYSSGSGSSRGSYSQPSQPSYSQPSQPSYSQPSQPSYNNSRTYSSPSPSYSAPSAPSSSGSSGGGGYSSGSGSSRGPR
jgi:hypothetical protein